MHTIEDLRDALLQTGKSVYHGNAFKKPFPYIVWGEDGEDSTYADNRRSTLVLTGTVDYFTAVEYDPAIKEIEAALYGAGVAFKLNSIQRENDGGRLKCVHFEWRWEGAVEQWQK